MKQRICVRCAQAAIALSVLIAAAAHGADWGQLKVDSEKDVASIEISSPDGLLDLQWHPRIVPGEMLLISKWTDTRDPAASFTSYVFLGVQGNAMQLRVGAGVPAREPRGARPEAPPGPTLYVERAPDGAYYFVPEALKYEGHLKVARSLDQPAFYTVTLVKRPGGP